jgi:hypothetical protein
LIQVDQGDESSGQESNVITVPRGTTKAKLLELNKLLQDNKGSYQVTLIFQNGHGERRLDLPFGVDYRPELRTQIADLLTAVPITD